MAANYWLSTQCNTWLIDAAAIAQARTEDLQYASADELAALGMWCSMVIGALCKRLGLRQRITATASVYCKRFYCVNSYSATDPMLVIAACVYLAAKVDEMPVRIGTFCTETAKLYKEMGFQDYNGNTNTLAEMEFYLLEDLDCDLVVFHPYSTILTLAKDTEHGAPIDSKTVQMAWLIVNDMYRTELPLQYPPYVLAVSSIYLALVLQPQNAEVTRTDLDLRDINSPRQGDAVALLAKLNVSLTAIAQVSQIMIGHYELYHRLWNEPGGIRDHNGMFTRLKRMYSARRDEMLGVVR
ncbi:RNA polymerase II holoenzyme cyclin-like subunit [Malassezia cuniculi]|uniref:RNA polymerase II holoenzyme cyclin-like subunit n=1 Tax=Malassezia cuniculi TaxID=948313 RepID=A0AAF0J5Q3_9BASI|nr:RNA polymerase II holoenzyme cyclin-like subunit [Malassezia cuniculi]